MEGQFLVACEPGIPAQPAWTECGLRPSRLTDAVGITI